MNNKPEHVPLSNRPMPWACDWEAGLAYELLLRLVASFGGGPNVNSRCMVMKGG